jgi:hypothetical protein
VSDFCCDIDKIPVYHLQHSIRVLVLQRCETTLSWEQLRSPQISQFLVKPIQQEIRSSHYSRATLCALLSNCLQFQKDGEMSPGTVGMSRTRALICELLAMRLLRDYSTREVGRIQCVIDNNPLPLQVFSLLILRRLCFYAPSIPKSCPAVSNSSRS